MSLPPFDYHAPGSLKEALRIKGDLGSSAAILAGGTDLLVNLKNGLFSPAAVISLKNIKELKAIELQPAALVIGAGASLIDIAEHPAVREHFPILVKAVQSIGAVGIQAYRGSIGGNICLTPRCILYNQSWFWRSGKGSCHRTGGKECHALQGSESCQSICSADTAPVLTALGAELTLTGPSGERAVPMADFYSGKGESPFNILPEEILTSIKIFLPWSPLSWSYQRLAMRSAVDFPLVNAAAVAIVDKGKIEQFRLTLSALGPAPVTLRELEASMKGSEPNENMPAQAAESALRVAEGVVVENAVLTKQYRIHAAGVLARRAVSECLGFETSPKA